jgi:hypothetical protein
MRNVTAAYGIEGFTADHLEAFKRHGVEQVLIAFDRDEAGDRGVEKVAKQLVENGMSCYRVQFPRGMDANEYARKMSPPAKALELALRSAVWMGGAKRPPALATPMPTAIETPAASAPPPTPPATPSPPASPVEAPSLAAPPPAAAAPLEAAPMAPVAIVESTAPGAVPMPDVPCEVTADEVRFAFGDRRYRIRGLSKNTSFDALKVNVLAARGEGERFHVDTLDLYGARQRAIYSKQGAVELGVEEDVIKADLGKVLLKLEALQDAQIRAAMAPKETAVVLTDEETVAALELLRDPHLLDRILEDFRRCGVVGEETNKLVGYLAAVSRKLDDPLAVVIQSSSAAGKSSLMDAVLAFVPEEERVKYAAMTGQSLFYMGETNLRHKILAVVEEEGAARASYALKILQSEGELTIASTGKDPETGKLVTHEYRVEGPVMIFLTTTAIEIDEELLNRCLVLSVDEEREQTRAIHEMQRWGQTLEGMLARAAKKDVLKVHRNAQRLLRALMVVNPHACELTFVDRQTRSRRDHTKYLGLIRTIALLHQHQRPVKTAAHGGQAIEYIEATLDDIAVANRLADQVLGRTLDELPPQTRRLLLLVDEHVGAACARLAMERKDFRFSRREVREATGWGNTQLKIHLGRLEELEYLTVHRGSRGQGFVYELAYDGKGKDGAPFLSGLIDLGRLGYDEKKSGVTAWWSGLSAKRSAPSRAEVGGVSGGGRGAVSGEILEENVRNGLSPSRKVHQGAGANGLPYSNESVVLAAAAAEPKVN